LDPICAAGWAIDWILENGLAVRAGPALELAVAIRPTTTHVGVAILRTILKKLASILNPFMLAILLLSRVRFRIHSVQSVFCAPHLAASP
jgi:hypothetical protein